MKRLTSIMLAALLACACGDKIKTEEDSDTDLPSDIVIEGTDVTTEGVCTAGEGECLEDGVTLRRCRSDETGYEEIACPVGCEPDPTPHCAEWSISNIDDMEFLFAGDEGERDWTGDAALITGDHWVGFNTESGRITVYVEPPPDIGTPSWEEGMELRDPGPGLDPVTGVAFNLVRQSDGTRLGVFSFKSFTLPPNFTIGVVGTYPLVIMSEQDALIEGKIEASCIWDSAIGPTYGHAGESGDGDGAGGEGGVSGSDYGGGGGGGYGGPGAAGSGNGGLGGAGGGTYGSSELIPLIGGSGGGWSGGPTGDSLRGSRGGRSGGAVEIVSGGTLTIAAGGWVDASGCGGYSSWDETTPFGGGGGGSGGSVLLEAPTLVVEGAVTVNGGGGGAGGYHAELASTFGQPGQGGVDTAATGGSPEAGNGCSGGTGNGGGGDSGSAAPDCTNELGGGGGGGAGRIRLNGQDRTITGLLSPATSSEAVTEGDLVLP
jgi:hypothetical protein